MNEILLVEDDVSIAEMLRLVLEQGGFALAYARSLGEGRKTLERQAFTAILLDLNLPDGDGRDFCQEIRRSSKVPIIMLTARREEVDRILGLELGADDYIVKPFSPREVVARIRAVLRRQGWSEQSAAGPELLISGVRIDEERHEVWVDGELTSLTRIELRLLRALASRPGRVFTREELIEAAWDGAFIQDRVVDSVISRLRRKLGSGDCGERIRTVHGIGYSMGADSESG